MAVDIVQFFPSIQHNVMVKLLIKQGFSDKMANLIGSFFQNRKMTYKWGQQELKEYLADLGTPQGDCLSPVLSVTITVRTPALCLLDTSDKSFSLCLPYSSLTLCLIRTDNPTSLLIPFLVRYLCSTYDSFLITNTVLSLIH